MAEKSKPPRWQGRKWFLTYPKCSASINHVVDIMKRIHEAAVGIVAQERHADGTLHIHAFIDCDPKRNYTTSTCFDIPTEMIGDDIVLGPWHGKYEHPASDEAVIRYCAGLCEEKGNRLNPNIEIWGEYSVQDLIARYKPGGKQKRVWAEIGSAVASGQSTKQIVMADMSRGQHLAKIESLVSAYRNWNLPVKPEFQEICRIPTSQFDITAESVISWINLNIKMPRYFKQKQLYIYGNTGLGKTSLINLLSQYLNIYIAPYDGEWFDDYNDDYDLVVFDEFRAQYTIQWMNQFMEGSLKAIRRRCSSPYLKKTNIPVIILSNFSPREAYSKVDAERLETLLARLTVCQVTRFLDLFHRPAPFVGEQEPPGNTTFPECGNSGIAPAP